ncbi:MAG: hypothetical protein ABSA76_14505 [Bacteroidales bacterium]|jgi:hypothetical protein
MKIDYFIYSTNENVNYIYCWPLVAQVTTKLFGCKVALAFITEREKTDPLVKFFQQFGEVYLFKAIEGIPSGNQAKVTRLYLASILSDVICCLNDVDILPLQSLFLTEKLNLIPSEKFVTIGANAYKKTVDTGKFPMIYTTARGEIFKNLINPQNLSYISLLQSWCGLKKFDNKESLNNIPSCFSDESLLKLLISNWSDKLKVVYLDRNFIGYKAVERIDRVDWNIDMNKLKAGWYIDAHLPRPLKSNLIKPLTEYFGVKDYIDTIITLH